MTKMYGVKDCEREAIRDFVGALGYDPADVAHVEICPDRVIVDAFIRNPGGGLVLDHIGPRIVTTSHRIVDPVGGEAVAGPVA